MEERKKVHFASATKSKGTLIPAQLGIVFSLTTKKTKIPKDATPVIIILKCHRARLII